MATTWTSAYNPKGNGQVERYNGIIWKTINLALKSNKLHVLKWESVITDDALHSISITNIVQLQEMPCLQSKYDPLAKELKLLDANPEYIHVKFANGRESTVSLWDLAPHSKTFDHSVSITPNQLPNYNRNVEMNCETVVTEVHNEHSEICTESLQIPTEESTNTEECVNNTIKDEPVLCRSVDYKKLQKN